MVKDALQGAAATGLNCADVRELWVVLASKSLAVLSL